MATLILSPHFDDAVLSCWHLLVGRAEVGVVNVFAGSPPADAVGWWDLFGGMPSSHGVVERRRDEDRAALALAGREAVNLEFLDYQYRPHPQPIEPVIEALRARLTPETTLWAPAALATVTVDGRELTPAARGPHPDHVAVRDAAIKLHRGGCPVMLYADLPHASACGLPAWVTGDRNGAVAAVAESWRRCLADASVDPADAEIHRLSGRRFARKLEAVRRYSSQITALERGLGKPIDAPELLDYELVWQLR